MEEINRGAVLKRRMVKATGHGGGPEGMATTDIRAPALIGPSGVSARRGQSENGPLATCACTRWLVGALLSHTHKKRSGGPDLFLFLVIVEAQPHCHWGQSPSFLCPNRCLSHKRLQPHQGRSSVALIGAQGQEGSGKREFMEASRTYIIITTTNNIIIIAAMVAAASG